MKTKDLLKSSAYDCPSPPPVAIGDTLSKHNNVLPGTLGYYDFAGAAGEAPYKGLVIAFRTQDHTRPIKWRTPEGRELRGMFGVLIVSLPDTDLPS